MTPAPVGGGAARFAYAGRYTRGAADAGDPATPRGISVFAVAPDGGALAHVQTVASENPSFLAFHPSQRFLYAVAEIDDHAGRRCGAVEAYAIDPATGELTLIDRQGSGSAGPTHLAVAPSGSHVVVANYAGGTFVVLPIRDDGGVDPVCDELVQTGSGPNRERQEAPHPHGVAFDSAGDRVVTADLGIDKVQVFRLDATAGRLEPAGEASVAPGAGPRHLAFHPSGRFLYVINELDATVTVFAYDPGHGQLGDELQTISTVPDGFAGSKSTAEIAVHPSGRFVYGSNRKQPDATSPEADSIVGYAVDQASGNLTPIGYATEGIRTPRHFALDPTGTWLYTCNQDGGTIVQFRIDQATGGLAVTGHVVETPTPVCLVFKNA